MSLVVLDNVSLSFGKQTIVEGIQLRVAEGDRIGLVGPNGSGKTSLMRLIAREQSPDGGTLQERRGLRVGYLPQDLVLETDDSLLTFVRSSVPGRVPLEEEIAATEIEIAQLQEESASEDRDARMMSAAERIAELHERLATYDQQFGDHEALRILSGLGFATDDHERPLAEFSGGWKMRGVLAALLFQQPDLLLLDEPTNHLDMPSVAWFGSFLQRYKGAFLLICHDRDFVNEQIQRIVSFEPEGLRQYDGNYDRYLLQRAEEEVILQNKAKNLAREREHAERFVERFRAQASKARAVQSRVKSLEKMESVELYRHHKAMHLTFPPCERSGNDVIYAEGLRKAFGDRVVLDNVRLRVQRGEKIGIVGVNGAGKTTLLKMLAGELAPDSGTIRLGHNVKVGYYAQHHTETLHPSSTIFDEVARQNKDASVTRVRTLLGSFLFSNDAVDKQIRVLSGGERARVALARLLIDPGNVLLMDEPTNHLDIASSEGLAEALSGFDGSIVFVSHSRSFIRRLATSIWNVANGTLETYDGTLDEYLDSCRQRQELQASPTDASATSGDFNGRPSAAPQKKLSRAEEKERKRREADVRAQRRQQLKPLKALVADLEGRISGLEAHQATLHAELAKPEVYDDVERSKKLSRELHEIGAKLDQLTDRWEQALAQLDQAQAELGESANT